ncbi:MAG: hypothetical protein IKL89_03745 [Clostridia bacterium]|nr:hypothetical protein [Clostridia bacterium]
MKNKFFYEYIDRLYAAAKEKHGERAEEALTDAVRKTAGKFKKLGEKAYVTALLQELGVGAFYEAEESAPEGLIEKLEVAFEEGLLAAKKKNRKFALIGCAAAVCLAVVGGFALRGAAPSAATTIEGAKEFTSGDFVLSNVHTVNDFTGFDGEYGKQIKIGSKYQISSTVAPDGTVYLLAPGADADGYISFGLYRMVDGGWENLCFYSQHTSVYADVRNFVFCDAESRPVVFLCDLIGETITAYTEKTEEIASAKVRILCPRENIVTNIVASTDGDSVYFAGSNGASRIDHLVFDFESRKFRQVTAPLSDSSLLLSAIAHKDDLTYLLAMDSSFKGGDKVYLYAYKNYAEATQEKVFEKQLYSGGFSMMSNPADSGSLLVDDEGKVYAFFTFFEEQMKPASGRHALEIVSAEGESLISQRFKVFNIGNYAIANGIFMDTEGTLYFIERGTFADNKEITIGVISGKDYGKCKKAASFKSVETPNLLPPLYINNPADKYGLYVDLLGVITQASSMQCGYMRLQLK